LLLNLPFTVLLLLLQRLLSHGSHEYQG